MILHLEVWGVQTMYKTLLFVTWCFCFCIVQHMNNNCGGNPDAASSWVLSQCEGAAAVTQE